MVLALAAAAASFGCGQPLAEGPSLSSAGGSVAAGGSSAASAGGSGGTAEPSQCTASPPPVAPLALLTREQYDNTVFDLLGDASGPSRNFPPENQVEGFKNDTSAHQASPLLVEKYLEAAEGLAQRAVATRLDSIAPCPSQNTAACGRDFVRSFGLRAFRRPLTTTESQLFDELFTRANAQSGYGAAVGMVLQTMLQSPQFLYRIDALAAPTPETGAVALGPYELASRLSYFLNGSMPDAELFAAAAANELSTDAQITAQAQRLLALPRAKEVVRSFHHQWLALDSLAAVARDLGASGVDANGIGKDWLTSLDRFIDHVYWESGNVSELFDSKLVYLNPRLASLYGAPAPAGADFSPVELADRAGLITQPALLALLAHSEQSAPVLRGVFVLERLMCVSVPPPPPNVANMPPDPDPSLTTRERFRVHTESTACAGCHRLIDGVGFGFEEYDQVGRFRSMEFGLPVDASGEVLPTGDASLDGPFNGAAELAQRLASSSRVRDCIAGNWYRFALGRKPTAADECSLDEVKSSFAASSGDLKALLVAITRSVAFRYRPALSQGAP